MKSWVLFERLEERDLDFVPSYRKAAAASVAMFGGKYRSVSFNNPVVEGPDVGPGPRMIGIKEFESRQDAEQWFNSAAYQEARKIRLAGSSNRTMIVDLSLHPQNISVNRAVSSDQSSDLDRAWVIFERFEDRNLDFVPEYRKISGASIMKFDGQYRTVSFDNRIVEGPGLGSGPSLISIIGFRSRAQAEAWFYSNEYAAAIELRKRGASNRVMIVDITPPSYAFEAGAA